jgi:8-oxo-dGTP pyrophosphatase MutT (NUDIX family)
MTRTRAAREIAAGGVVVHTSGGQPKYLLIRDGGENWGFPKGHIEPGESPEDAARREVEEETGLSSLVVRGEIDTIDWYFRFRGRLVHKVCSYYLMESNSAETSPQAAEGITECQWLTYDEANTMLTHANARRVLDKAQAMLAPG